MVPAVSELLVLFRRLPREDQQSFLAQVYPVRTYLTSWREILNALGMKLTASFISKVRRLNLAYDGPIILGTKGKQPEVEKGDLLGWYDRIHIKYQAAVNQRRAAQETVAFQHPYGRRSDLKVVPGISGHTKSRRAASAP